MTFHYQQQLDWDARPRSFAFQPQAVEEAINLALTAVSEALQLRPPLSLDALEALIADEVSVCAPFA